MRGLACVVGLLVSLAVWSAPGEIDDQPYVVELAVFSCPHCYRLDSEAAGLRRDLGDHFIFAPVVTDPTRDYAGRTYYALRNHVDRDALRTSLFELIRKMRFDAANVGEVVAFLNTQGIDTGRLDVESLVRSDQTTSAIRRTVRLAREANVNLVPAMVIVRNNEISSVHRMSPGDQVGSIVQSVREALNRGQQ